MNEHGPRTDALVPRLGPTEHAAQVQLADLWGRSMFALGGYRLCLIGWEVMPPDWAVNDSRHTWNRPSVDFLAVTSTGQLAAIEIKMRVGGPVEQARACAQVTAAALAISASATPQRIQGAYAAAHAGAINRHPLGNDRHVFDHVSSRLGLRLDAELLRRPVRRILALVHTGARGYREEWSDADIDLVLAGSVAKQTHRMRRRLAGARELSGATVADACEVYAVPFMGPRINVAK